MTGHRARGVLLSGDRHDPGTRDQSEGGLVPDDAVGAGRADDRPVGLRADRHLGQRRGDTRAGTRRRATRIAIEDMGVGGQPADRTPPARRVGAAEVGPLRQVRLADDHRAGRPEPLDQPCVVRRTAAQQRPGSRGGRQRSSCRHIDVVLEQDRDTFQRAARPLEMTAQVTAGCLQERQWVHGEDGVQLVVDLTDAGEVGQGQRGR